MIVVPRFSYSITPSVSVAPVAVALFGYDLAHWADPLAAIWQPPKLRV